MRPALLALLLAAAAPAAAEIDGPLRVIDGDTFEVAGVTIRLFGIDAPERDQSCGDAQGRPFPCGSFVTEEVARRWGGAEALCTPVETDRYGRTVARCRVAGVDLGEAIVAAGLARAFRAYALDYDMAERGAALAGAGLWAGEFTDPAAFRSDAPPLAEGPPGDCTIKGNISQNGRIYHMPWNEGYARTRIDEGAGERWFCSEAEAQAAGWRPARN